MQLARRWLKLLLCSEAAMDLSIVLPCYNEAENIAKIRRELLPVATELTRDYSLEVVFVDDGSTDGTWLALTEAFGGADVQIPVRFERHRANRGLGAALRTGLSAACGEVVVTTDSDGTYKFSEIPALLSCLVSGVDVVTASPYHPAGSVAGVPAYRLVLSRGSSTIYRLLVDWRVHTYTALFRAYRRAVVESITFEADGFLAGTELLVKSMLAGYHVAEYPAILHSRSFGVSKAKLVRTILAHLRFQVRILLHRLHLTTLVRQMQTGRMSECAEPRFL
ncbi:MAG: glycosyltransferase family 2 protein [Chloroflexi bacterium]|nr:glycosyltransferase family 2 protein [Chloroflexota bacterium]